MSAFNKNDNEFQSYVELLEEYSDDSEKEVKKEEKGEKEAEKMLPSPPSYNKPVKKKKDNPFSRLSLWFNNLPKKKKIIVSVIAVILAMVIVLGIVAGIFVANKFNLMGDNIDKSQYDDTIYEDGDFGSSDIDIGSAGFKQALQDWATTGNEYKMKSRNVINVLLVGADSRNGENEGNTDVMMLVSLNKKTKQLKMVSFLRDSYLYIQGKNGSYCSKLNAAFSMGGPETLMQTIENNYKIDIDSYVMVNFESFAAIVDAMGGVTVDVQKYEADYNLKRFKLALPYGEDVTLNGKQALCFCRIRNCDADGDVSRTRRQRQVIDAIIDKVKSASIKDLNKYIDTFLPYVDTGYSETQIISLGVNAITGKWFNYERTQLQAPDEDCRTSGSANSWIWVVDYQLAAHRLQKELYGESNITVDEGRTSIIDVYRGANYSGSSSAQAGPSPSATAADSPEPVTDNKKPDIITEPESTTEAQASPETTEAASTEADTTSPETTAPQETVPQETAAPTTQEQATAPVQTEAPVTEQ